MQQPICGTNTPYIKGITQIFNSLVNIFTLSLKLACKNMNLPVFANKNSHGRHAHVKYTIPVYSLENVWAFLVWHGDKTHQLLPRLKDIHTYNCFIEHDHNHVLRTFSYGNF